MRVVSVMTLNRKIDILGIDFCVAESIAYSTIIVLNFVWTSFIEVHIFE